MKIVVMLICMILLMHIQSLVYAEEEELILWTPSNMIVGEEYEGVVILKRVMDHDIQVRLSSSNDLLGLQESVTIKANKNHGIFKITPKDEGESTIFAILDNNLIDIDVKMYKTEAIKNSLKIILQADSTKVGKILGYIFLVDNQGLPVRTDNNLEISLISDKSIKVIDKVTIAEGKYYTSFIANVDGSGYIYAIAEETRPGKVWIEKSIDNASVRLAIAPHIAMPESKAYFYVWLEKDGKLYIPNEKLDVVLTSSNADVASFSIMFEGLDNSATKSLELKDGFVKGEIFTKGIGNATITAAVKGIGVTTSSLIVGALEIEEVTISTNKTESIKTTRLIPIDSNAIATDILSFIYPSVISREYTADGIVSLYNIKHKQEEPEIISVNNTVTTISRTITTITPIDNAGENYRSINIISDGLIHPSILDPSIDSIDKHSIVFPVDAASNGKYTLSAFGSELNFSQTVLEVKDVYRSTDRLLIRELPILANSYQPLAIVSLVDENGALIGVDEVKMVEPKLVLLDNNIGYTLTGSIDKSITITLLHAQDFIDVNLKPTSITSTLELDLPKLVHEGEEIPFVLHLTSNGIPFAKLYDYDVSGMNVSNNHIIATNGSVIFITEHGVIKGSVNTFLNELFFDINVDKEEGNVDDDATITVNTNGMLSIDTDLPYTINNNNIIVKFDKVGEHNLTLTANREGYTSIEKHITFLVKELVPISIEAASFIGAIEVPFTLVIDEEIKELQTPYITIIESQMINLTFPDKHANLDFQRAVINNNESIVKNSFLIDVTDRTSITAIYGKSVIINIEDAEGSGSYPLGGIVTLYASDRDIIPFIIKEKLDHWEGLPPTLDNKSNPLTFEVEESMNIKAVYTIDYTGIILPIIAIAIIVIFLIRKRLKSNLEMKNKDNQE